MKNRPFKYGTQIAFRETINGLLWCIAAFFWLFDNRLCRIIYLILLTLAILSQAFAIFGKFEKSDEMAIENLRWAKSMSLDLTRILFLFITIIIIFIPDESMLLIEWDKIIYPTLVFFVGFPELLTGILFKRSEEE